MIIEMCPVTSVRTSAKDVFVLGFRSPSIASSIQPGQFVNIRVGEGTEPLLRRPFSAYRIEGDRVEIIFNIVGRGTAAMSTMQAGDRLDVLGPLGVPFGITGSDYDTGILIGGGLGIAPLPLLTKSLRRANKNVLTFVGGRTASLLLTEYLENPATATDDGSSGFRGTVVDLVRKTLSRGKISRPKLFACGPTPMLKAVAKFTREANLSCEVSLEGPMGCGIGICQGCPVELSGEETKYALMCKDGPTFDIRSIKL
jgi:dihydroorotate dehydrogenase electron transfer subunit